jgi:hypothetical protein
MIEIDDLLPYGLLAIFILLYLTGNFSQKNKYHQGLLFALFASWLYFKGVHTRYTHREIIHPLKDYLNNKNDDKKE